MNVNELISILKTFDEDDLVVMSSDAEGNDYAVLRDIDKCLYVSNSRYSGEVYIREVTPEDRESGYTEEDLYNGDDGVNCIVLYP